MSTNRKRRLRKLTSAMIGAFSVAGSVANMNTNAQQETTSTLTTAGVGAGIISGLGILGLTAYNTFKDKKNPIEEEYRKIVLERQKSKKEKEDEEREKAKRQEELKAKYGLSDAEVTNVRTTINALRNGKTNLNVDEILSAISGMQNEEKILACAKANNVANTSKWINREIANELTIDKIKKSMAALRELPEGVDGTSMLTTVQLIGGVRAGTKTPPQTLNAQYAYNALTPNVKGQNIYGSQRAVTKNQIEAADALMPENVKTLVGGCWGVSPVCPTLGKSIAVTNSTAYGGVYISDALGNVGGATHAGFRKFTLKGWNGTGTGVYESGRMTGTFIDGRDGKIGMDLILGPDCNSNAAGVTTHSWGMGLGVGDTKNVLKKLNKAELKNLNASIFETVYEFAH